MLRDWEKFDWFSNADGTVSLRGNNGMYVSSENGTQAMTCTHATAGAGASFAYSRIVAAASQTSSTDNRITVSGCPNPIVNQLTYTHI